MIAIVNESWALIEGAQVGSIYTDICEINLCARAARVYMHEAVENLIRLLFKYCTHQEPASSRLFREFIANA